MIKQSFVFLYFHVSCIHVLKTTHKPIQILFSANFSLTVEEKHTYTHTHKHKHKLCFSHLIFVQINIISPNIINFTRILLTLFYWERNSLANVISKLISIVMKPKDSKVFLLFKHIYRSVLCVGLIDELRRKIFALFVGVIMISFLLVKTTNSKRKNKKVEITKSLIDHSSNC